MIRSAGLNDVVQIAALLRGSFDDRLHDFMVYTQHGISNFIGVHIATPVQEPSRHFLVHADDAGRIQAFAEFQEGTDDSALLSYICVAPEARGSGLAVSLIEHFTTKFPSLTLQLDVFADNNPALALYRKLGFQQTTGTSWFVRDLPDPDAAGDVRLTNAVEATSMYAHYGFCRLGIDWHGVEKFVGRIGPRTLRCFQHADFGDDALLAMTRRAFPETRSALFICPADAPDRPGDDLLFLSSLRLARPSQTSWES